MSQASPVKPFQHRSPAITFFTYPPRNSVVVRTYSPIRMPFWEAVIRFDQNGDGKIERKEMTGHFTFPIRPELPPGHPGFGIPLPEDKRRRQERLDGMFRGIDRNRDKFWTKEEFIANMRGGRGKPLLIAIRPGGQGDVTDTHSKVGTQPQHP